MEGCTGNDEATRDADGGNGNAGSGATALNQSNNSRREYSVVTVSHLADSARLPVRSPSGRVPSWSASPW